MIFRWNLKMLMVDCILAQHQLLAPRVQMIFFLLRTTLAPRICWTLLRNIHLPTDTPSMMRKVSAWSMDLTKINIMTHATLMGQRLNQLNRLHILESLRVLQLLSTRLELVRISTQVGKPSSVYLVMDIMELLVLIPSWQHRIINLYIQPCLCDGAEIWIGANREYEDLNRFHMKIMRMLQGLPHRMASAGVLALLGVLPNTARIHQAKLSLLVSVFKDPASYNYAVIQQQFLHGKSKSWMSEISDLLSWYTLPSYSELADNPPFKASWKHQVKENIKKYWEAKMGDEIASKTSLKYISLQQYTSGAPHPVWTSSMGMVKLTKQTRTRAKPLLGVYKRQSNLARFNQNEVDPTCKLCGLEPKDRTHFLAECPMLEDIWTSSMQSRGLQLSKKWGELCYRRICMPNSF